MIRALITPRVFYRSLPRFMRTSSGVTEMEVSDEGHGRLVITARPHHSGGHDPGRAIVFCLS